MTEIEYANCPRCKQRIRKTPTGLISRHGGCVFSLTNNWPGGKSDYYPHARATPMTHACSECGAVHKVKLQRNSTSVGDDPRDSSIDVVREQRKR